MKRKRYRHGGKPNAAVQEILEKGKRVEFGGRVYRLLRHKNGTATAVRVQ